MLFTLTEVAHEQARQRKLWGEQNHPSFDDKDLLLPRFNAEDLEAIRYANEWAVANNKLTWEHVLLEEVAEALIERDLARLREELVQVCAVAASWIESIDRNGH